MWFYHKFGDFASVVAFAQSPNLETTASFKLLDEKSSSAFGGTLSVFAVDKYLKASVITLYVFY